MASSAPAASERTPLLAPQAARASADSSSEAVSPGRSTTAEPAPADAEAEHEAFERAKEALPLSILVPSILSLFTVLFLAALDGTLTVTLVSSISSSFSAAELLPWLGLSYMLSTCVFSPIYGKLSDVVGRKPAILTALVLFMLGTGLCSTATSMAYLIAARAVAGMGGGGLLTCTSIILTDLLPLRKRGLFQGLTQIIFSIGSALGGPVGGFLTEALGWRAAFGVQVPLLGLSTLAIVIFLRLPPHPSSSGPTSTAGFSSRAMTLLGRMDLLGSLFLVTSLLSLLFGLSLLSASRLPFSHPAVYSCLLAFPLLAAAFVYVESIVKEPVLPLRLLRQRTTVCASLFYLLSSAAITGLFFHLPLYFEAVLLQSPRQAGLHFIPLSVFTSLGSVGAGLYMKWSGRYWWLLLACNVATVTSTAYLATWNERTSDIGTWLGITPCGGGAGAYTIMLVAVISSLGRADQAAANGLIYLMRGLGQVVGLSLLGALFQELLATQLNARITGPHARETIERLRHDTTYILRLGDKLQKEATASYAFAFRGMMLAVTVLSVLCILLGMGVREHSLGGEKKADEEGAPAGPAAAASQEERA